MFVTLWRSRFRLFGKHYGPAYNWATRQIVRVGVRRREREMRRLLAVGTISQGEFDEQAAACAQVDRMTR